MIMHQTSNFLLQQHHIYTHTHRFQKPALKLGFYHPLVRPGGVFKRQFEPLHITRHLTVTPHTLTASHSYSLVCLSVPKGNEDDFIPVQLNALILSGPLLFCVCVYVCVCVLVKWMSDPVQTVGVRTRPESEIISFHPFTDWKNPGPQQ